MCVLRIVLTIESKDRPTGRDLVYIAELGLRGSAVGTLSSAQDTVIYKPTERLQSIEKHSMIENGVLR